MRQLAAAITMVLTVAGADARAQGAAAPEPDYIGAALATLETGLASTNRDELRAALDLAPWMVDWLETNVPPRAGTFVAITERSRSAAHVLAEVFVAAGARGMLATWQIAVIPAETTSGAKVVEITEISRYVDLVRLELDDAHVYRVTDLVVTGPDFELRVPAGTMFMSLADDRPTAIVVLGDAHVRFTPPDPAEQGQMRIFTGDPVLETRADTVFIRINAADATRAIRSLTSDLVTATPVDLARARAVLDERAPLSFQVNPIEDAPGLWSVEPELDSRLVEFRTNRYGWLTYARSPDDLEDVSLFQRETRKQVSLYSHAPSINAVFTSVPTVSAARIDVTFDPVRQWFSGVAHLSLSLDRVTSSLSVRLDDSLVVDGVWSPVAGYLLALRPAGLDALVIALPPDLQTGVVELDIQYRGSVEPQRLSNDRVEDGRPIRLVEDFPWPIEPRYLYTIGRWWYPSIQGGVGAATIRISVPEGYRAIANGTLVETVTSAAAAGRFSGSVDRVTTYEYRSDRAVPYLSCLVTRTQSVGTASALIPAAEDATGGDATSTVAIATFVGRDRSARMRNTPDRVQSIVEFYASVLGGAPYPSLTVVTLEELMPGGHSPAYFSLLNVPHVATPLVWSRDPAAFDDAPDFFLAHEIAHQWWGQAVSVRTYRDQWISEGFAQYMAWLHEEATYGDAQGRRLMAQMRSTSEGLVAEGPIQLGSRLGHLREDRRIFRSLVYNKAAVVLHMLRRLVGDDAFFAGLRRLYAERRYQRTTTDQVRQAFQAETPLPIGRFFDRWIYGASVPILHFEWAGGSADSITIDVEQMGETFDLPYDVTLEYADGTRERRLLRLHNARESFTIPTRAPVRRVLFQDELTLAIVD